MSGRDFENLNILSNRTGDNLREMLSRAVNKGPIHKVSSHNLSPANTGRLQYNNGYEEVRCDEYKTTYYGHWLNGEKHGQGRLVWDDGASYEGSWVNGAVQGYGI